MISSLEHHRTSSPERDLLDARTRGSYQVVRELGRGGMGIVFLARDVKLHRMVAIKVLRLEFNGIEEYRERFRREARVTARLTSDGVVGVHGFDECDDLVYIVMEYINGQSLGAALAESPRGRMAAEAVRDILLQLARTLQRAHTQGIVHRDLKPENILISRDDGRARLTDFGVAINRNSDRVPGTADKSYGTPHFMSPEQSAGELDLDGRSDLYSLGVIGYLMLTGELPFDGPCAGALASKHIGEAHVPVRERNPRIPVELADAVERCLKKAPEERWASAEALVASMTNRSNRSNWLFKATAVASGVAVALALAEPFVY